MDIEFHYWITGYMAKEAGFSEEEAGKIAYSSQYVDDNDYVYQVEHDGPDKIYSNYISQTMDITKPQVERMRVYPIFHFAPGDSTEASARRHDGRMHIFNTTPNNDFANDMMKKAFEAPPEQQLYRIGLATHLLADSWSHQNFVGFQDSFNGDVLNPIPNIGHAEYLHSPDLIGFRWRDDRNIAKDIDNNLRFLSAAKAIYECYCEHTGTPVNWGKLGSQLAEVMGFSSSVNSRSDKKKRFKAYELMTPWLKEYDEDAWLDAAIDKDVNMLPDDKALGLLSKFTIFKDKYYWKKDQDKTTTDWFRFQESVKGHQEDAKVFVGGLCKQMGVDLDQRPLEPDPADEHFARVDDSGN